MPTGDNTDVTSTLTDLERKLVDLERELGAVAGPSSPIAAPTLPAPTPSQTHGSVLRVEDLRTEIADLVRFRDQLEAAARELVSEYDRLVERLRGSDAGPTAAPAWPSPAPAATVASPSPGPDPAIDPGPIGPAAAVAPAPGATAAYDPNRLPPAVAAGIPGQQAAAAPAPSEGDDLTFVGAVVIDAGPFGDITTLQAFEQGLARVDGAEDVYVRSFEGNRALIDVRLSNQVPLVQLLRNQLPLPIHARDAGEGRLTVDVMTADSHGN
jgi:hypothetical protein